MRSSRRPRVGDHGSPPGVGLHRNSPGHHPGPNRSGAAPVPAVAAGTRPDRRPKETTMGSGDVLYAVVQFDGEAWQAIDKVIVMFDSATAADGFALERGLADYAVAPLCVL